MIFHAVTVCSNKLKRQEQKTLGSYLVFNNSGHSFMTTKKINLTVISQSMYAHFALPCALLMSRNKNKQTQLELHLFPNSKCIMVGPSIRKYNSARFTHIYWSVFMIKTMICNIFWWVELHYFFIWWKSAEKLKKIYSSKDHAKH